MVKYIICIYGIGHVGNIFISQLKDNNEFNIKYIINQSEPINILPNTKYITNSDTYVPDNDSGINMSFINELKYSTLEIIKLNLIRKRHVLIYQHNTDLTDNDISEIYDLATENNAKLQFISHTKYYHNEKLLKSIKNGNIGKIYNMLSISSYTQNFDNLFNLCSHNIVHNNELYIKNPINVYAKYFVNGVNKFLNVFNIFWIGHEHTYYAPTCRESKPV